ncbi:MAG: MFS transporter [Anaerolineae bacterium]|jgi:MFS family permease|nr:MFS transporter [Anaerolineae bacterium]
MEKPRLKLDFQKTFLIGFGFFGTSVMWKLYNDYVPIFLQAGNPLFESATKTAGFGLGPGLTGFIMTLDNIVALFLLPLIGLWSDRIWAPKLGGRRRPFIVTLAPISIIAFILIPFVVRMIPPELSGMTDQLRQPLALFIAIVGLFITTMAGFRTPVISLMPDLTPSPLRSQANGIINLMGGVGGIIITFVGAMLYNLNIALPFIVSGVLMVLAVLMLIFFVKEPRTLGEPGETREEEEALDALKGVRRISPAARQSLILLMLSIFFWFVGYNAIETFFTSYGVNVLRIAENQASLLSSVSYVTFIAFAIPSGYIAAKIGRRRTITTGLVVFAALLLVGFFVPNIIVIGAALALGGIAWSLVNINSLPMVIDTSDSDANIGTFTGLYYLASQLAAIAGPTLNGFLIERFQNYNLVLLVPVIFFILAAASMQGVTRGEAKVHA